MGLLDAIDSPADLKALDAGSLPALATEIRDFLVEAVAKTGGHLGPNLGAVELTIALHRVFDSPVDKIVWDTGHQSYVHKILTGRKGDFDTLRQPGGMSGYPNRAESDHDLVENSHASTALSYAEGIAKAFRLRGERNRHIVAVVGDGALTGGMCWEALNNIAAYKDLPIVMVVNDNGRSYAPTIGGLAAHLANLRMTQGYESALDVVKVALARTPLVGPPLYEALHGIKRGLKDLVQPQVMFEDLGIKYVGPIDGHDIAAVESALHQARAFGSPVIVHCVTRKGYGYQPAMDDEADCLHGFGGPFDAVTGKVPAKTGAQPSWTSVFGEELAAVGAEDPAVVAITAAMLAPVGLTRFAEAFPTRVFDVGIAEQHAVTSAAGLAMGGMKPVVCLYATFLNRAFDQVLMDVALHDLPVTIALDRAGITGPDGASHNGMWDLAMLSIIPGMSVCAPRDAATLRAGLREAIDVSGPSVIRYPSGVVAEPLPVVSTVDGIDILHRPAASDVLLVSIGPLAHVAVEAAMLAEAHGVGVTVVDPHWVLPVSDTLVELASAHSVVVTIEDGLRVGGVGTRIDLALRDAGHHLPTVTLGIDHTFLDQGKREDLLRESGLSAQHIARTLVESVAGLTRPSSAAEMGESYPSEPRSG